MLSSRRDVLKQFGMGVALTQAAPLLLGGEPVSTADALTAQRSGEITHGQQAGGRVDDIVADEAAELIKFHKRLSRVLPRTPPSAVSVPFATFPLNVYMKLATEALTIPEPKIPWLHHTVKGGHDSPYPRAIAKIVARKLKLISPVIQIVDTPRDLNLTLPNGDPMRYDRVVSPKYVTDVDEPSFGMRTTATMLLDALCGIWKEWDNKIKAIADYGPIKCQAVHVQFWVHREAYASEMIGWNLGGGYARM